MQVAEDGDGAYARRLLEDARVRAIARRQLTFGLHIVVAGAFVAVISTIDVGGRATADPQDNNRSPISAPPPHHLIMLASAGAEEMPSRDQARGIAGSRVRSAAALPD